MNPTFVDIPQEEEDSPFADESIDVYALACSIFMDSVGKRSHTMQQRALAMKEFIEQMEQQNVQIEKDETPIVELHATEVEEHYVKVEEPVGVLPVDGMCYIDEESITDVVRYRTESEIGCLMIDDSITCVPLQEPQWVWRTADSLLRHEKEVEIGAINTKYPYLKPFVDLDWDSPVYMRAGKQWYKIYLQHAKKNSEAIRARARTVVSEYKFHIVSCIPPMVRDPNITIFVTGSRQKEKDYRAIARSYGKGFYPVVNLELTEIQGTAKEIALHKAKEAYELLQSPVLVEDVSLYIRAFGDAPGPYVKSWLSSKTISSMNTLVMGMKDRHARTEVIYCYYAGTLESVRYYISELIGTLRPMTTEKSAVGWGFNNWFVPQGYNKSIDRMSYQQQLSTGFRSNALRQFFLSPNSEGNRALYKHTLTARKAYSNYVNKHKKK